MAGYQIGDRIAHPLHGAGVISGIETRRVGGSNKNYYVMRIPMGDMLVMIPVDACEAVGIRPIIDSAAAENLFGRIRGLEISDNQNWNKRYRENMLRIRSGDLLEVAAVIKSLVRRDSERGLSTGERKMLHSAKQILISEIVLSSGASYDQVEERLYLALA
ncbi:MAG: CarD family transcriptional regulator [Oscillospiraceae bacterium]